MTNFKDEESNTEEINVVFETSQNIYNNLVKSYQSDQTDSN